MTTNITHKGIAWAKSKLEELDAIIAGVEAHIDQFNTKARQDADAALGKLRAVRDRLRGRIERVKAEADDVRDAAKSALSETAEDVEAEVEKDWNEVETAVQTLIANADDQAKATRQIVAVRVEAQRNAWQSNFEEIRVLAVEIATKARDDIENAVEHAASEADRIGEKIAQVPQAGNESLAAVKQGIADIKAANQRTIDKVKDALGRLF